MVGDSRFITLREAYTDNFDKVGQSAIYPGLKVAGNNYQAVSTKWVEDASYVRLENISLSYNLSKKSNKVCRYPFDTKLPESLYYYRL